MGKKRGAYTFEKRQKELAKKKKRQEKLERRRKKKADDDEVLEPQENDQGESSETQEE
jgi:hypothetical protein